MPRSSLQFHADPEELVSTLLPRWIDDAEDVHFLAVTQRPPYRCASTGKPDISDPERGGMILANLRPIKSIEEKWLQVVDANPNSLTVIIGDLVEGGLRETLMGMGTDDPAALSRWRTAFRRARSELQKGAVFVNPIGDRFDTPNHRYSEGALKLARSGVPMLSITGGTTYELNQSSNS